jgi:hypothetical protein
VAWNLKILVKLIFLLHIYELYSGFSSLPIQLLRVFWKFSRMCKKNAGDAKRSSCIKNLHNKNFWTFGPANPKSTIRPILLQTCFSSYKIIMHAFLVTVVKLNVYFWVIMLQTCLEHYKKFLVKESQKLKFK